MPDKPDAGSGNDAQEAQDVREATQALAPFPEYDWLTKSGTQWYTVAEVADQLAISKEAVRGWCERGLIVPANLYGQQIGWRLSRSGLLVFFARIVRGGGRLPADGTNG